MHILEREMPLGDAEHADSRILLLHDFRIGQDFVVGDIVLLHDEKALSVHNIMSETVIVFYKRYVRIMYSLFLMMEPAQENS